MSSRKVNLLEYLRSKSNVDFDCLDLQLSNELGPFVDCTSNQADAYLELLKPPRAALLQQSTALARDLQSEYPGVSYEDLALEISMVNLSLKIAPSVKGAVYVMSNPLLQTSMTLIIENAQRIYSLARRIEPGFDLSRLCIKVVATWEGLQACKKLKGLGVKTLATTVFTFEQAVLAAEAGCTYISPFLHELKAVFDDSYRDDGPMFELVVKAQRYYDHHYLTTRMKAAAAVSVEEVLRLAGSHSITVAPTILREMYGSEALEEELAETSIFKESMVEGSGPGKVTYINNEVAWRKAFAESDGGKGIERTQQAIDIFCDYQRKAEVLMLENDPKRDQLSSLALGN